MTSSLPGPLHAVLDLSSRCNLRCRYCCFFSSEAEAACRELSTEAMVAKIAECAAAGVWQVTLRGGEALLRGDFPEILRAVIDSRMRFTLLTNGILLDDKFAAAIAASRRCDFVKVSLDGPEELHDEMRGAGSWRAAVAAIDRLRRVGVPVLATAAIHRGHLGRIAECTRTILEYAPQISFSMVIDCAERSCALDDDTYLRLLAEIAAVERSDPGRFPERGAVAVIRAMRTALAAMRRGDPPPARDNWCSNRRTVFMLADGRWFVCPSLPEMASAPGESLTDFWFRSPLWDGLRTPHTGPWRAECANCRCREYCNPGCYLTHRCWPERHLTCPMRFVAVAGEDF